MKIEALADDKKYQQYFTNPNLAKEIVKMSGIDKLEGNIEILEPTAGDGALIKPVIETLLNENIHIDLIEIDEKERQKLKTLVNKYSNTLSLIASNFLSFIPSKRYDVILMNPPFHIRGSTNALLERDVYDFDFVMKAYAMLKVGGVLVAITSKSFTFRREAEEFRKLLKIEGDYKIKKDEKFSNGVKIDVSIIKMIKTTEIYDNKIFEKQYYKNVEKKGQAILNNVEKV